MIGFEESVNPNMILSIAKKYFARKEYCGYINFLKGNFDKCPPKIKSELLQMLGIIYNCWQSYDQAILALKFAIKFDENNSKAYLNLAKTNMYIGNENGFKSAFIKYSDLDYDGLANCEDLINYFNGLGQSLEEDDFVLVDDDFRVNNLFNKANIFLDKGDIDSATKCLELLITKYPNFKPAYELFTFVCLTNFDDTKLAEITQKRYDNFPDDLEVIAMYLYTKRNDLDYDDSILVKKLLGGKIESMLTLKRVCEVLDAKGQYVECLELVNAFAENNNLKNNYDILMMQMVAKLKLGDKKTAKSLLNKIRNYYGMFGLGFIYQKIIDYNIKNTRIVNYNYLSDDLWQVAHNLFEELYEKHKSGKQCSEAEFFEVFELLFVTADEDEIIGFLYTFKEEFTIKYAEKIISLLYFRHVPNIIKVGVLYALILCGITNFVFVTDNGRNCEKLLPIPSLDEFPNCYRDAYYYAFAYCGLNLEDFSENLQTSTMELLDAMKTTKRKFRDEFALAAAIICNSYVLVGDDIPQMVSNMVECSAKRVKTYINIIQKNGEFFDLEDDDVFELFVKRIANKITEDFPTE